MKCYYEVLEVPRDADDATIKSCYKKLALRWHPDKNLDNPEEAKEQFQLLQQAYDVLSDRQERAWYDSHREQILRSADSEFEDSCLNVYQYFTTSCFKGYGDDEKGFYTVYRKVFEEIAKEDLEFMEHKDEMLEIPTFGDSKSDYDEVVARFYSYWSNYLTKKSYVWLDPYKNTEIRGGKILKLMDKENKKIRQKAKKERNEEVQSLVAFVRKRDKRVQAQIKLQEVRRLENKKKFEQISKQKRLERKKQLNESAVPEWSNFDNLTQELEQIEKHLASEFGEDLSNSDDDNDDISEVDSLYCLACNKPFKTDKSFKNHESSKKHRENVEKLRQKMMADENFDESLEEYDSCPESVEDYNEKIIKNSELPADNFEEVASSCESDIGLDEKINKSIEDDVTKERNSSSERRDEDTSSGPVKKSKKKKKQQKVLRVENENENHDAIEPLSDSNAEFKSERPKRKNKNKLKQNKDTITTKAEGDANTIINGVEEVDRDKKSEDSSVNNIQTSELNNTAAKSLKSKNEKKKGKGASNEDKSQLDADSSVDVNHVCVTCQSNFLSKNKLFEHLKKTGHSVYLPPTTNTKKGKSRKSKRSEL